MHDLRLIRENPAEFDAMLARRGLAPLSLEILAIDAGRREKITAAGEALGSVRGHYPLAIATRQPKLV